MNHFFRTVVRVPMKKASAFFMGSPDPPPGPMQNADAFCMGTRPLRASPCRGGRCLVSTAPNPNLAPHQRRELFALHDRAQ